MADEPLEFPPFTADSIADRLDEPVPDGYASFKGYLAPKRENGRHRFFGNDTFLYWMDIAADDIVARINVPANAIDPRSMIYVKREARVITCQVRKAHEVDVDADPTSVGLPPPPWRSS